MKTGKYIGAAMGVAVLTMAFTAALPATEASAHCGGYVKSRTIWAHYRSNGRFRARQSWSFWARKAMGSRHRKWSKAHNRHYEESYKPGSYWRWRIRAVARPCH